MRDDQPLRNNKAVVEAQGLSYTDRRPGAAPRLALAQYKGGREEA
jgi:hypothetical protein